MILPGLSAVGPRPHGGGWQSPHLRQRQLSCMCSKPWSDDKFAMRNNLTSWSKAKPRCLSVCPLCTMASMAAEQQCIYILCLDCMYPTMWKNACSKCGPSILGFADGHHYRMSFWQPWHDRPVNAVILPQAHCFNGSLKERSLKDLANPRQSLPH